ncbi:MAG: gamma-glutamyltransferase [Rhodocyclaceae bacterium]|jgi:gamma-glutamyltranspeptidase/glutathione hydrolase|nr:gamma-glutamyltransferase [Rhodocyclaceae bacterium]
MQIFPRCAGAALVALLLHAAAWADLPSQPEAASGFVRQQEAHGRLFMAVTANRHATDAAVEILHAGGTAADAVIAAQLVLNLVEPQSSGLGGGGFLLYHDAREGRLRAYDGRETAPAAARPDRFIGADGKPLAFYDAAVGGQSVGVPGLPALIELAYRNHGRLPWPRLFAPAMRLAVEGFPMSPRLHKLLQEDRFLRDEPRARALYYQEDGRPKPIGTKIFNRDLAATLLLLAHQGSKGFYEGAIAHDIVAAVRGHARRPGDLSEADFAAYRAVEREPVCGVRFSALRVCGIPPPSSGGVGVLQMLAYVGAGAVEVPLSPFSVHRFSEAGRLTYADRGRYLADPDFVRVPVKDLLDPAYLARRAQLIREERSMGRAQPGELPEAQTLGQNDAAELPSTSHLSIVDGEGNAAALTSSIENAFGSRIMVRGFLLNNQLTDFSFRPEENGLPVANRIEPGKRPLSSMAPTMVFDRDGRIAGIVGSPGGSQIINYVAQALMALFVWQLPPAEALALPHFGSRNGPTELERGTPAEALKPALEKLGHEVVSHDMTSGLHVIVRKGSEWIGAADPRREGAARGE